MPYFKPAAILQQNSKSIYTSFKIFMYFSQILGVLPQKNLSDRVEGLTFSWKCWRVYYSLVVMALLGVAVACCFIYWADHGSSINALGKFGNSIEDHLKEIYRVGRVLRWYFVNGSFVHATGEMLAKTP